MSVRLLVLMEDGVCSGASSPRRSPGRDAPVFQHRLMPRKHHARTNSNVDLFKRIYLH